MPGKLYLIPNTIHDSSDAVISCDHIVSVVRKIRYFFIEEEKSARRLLKKIVPDIPFAECAFFLLNEHSSPLDIEKSFFRIQENDMGLISQAGCPCVADPGSDLVLLAHRRNIQVVPLVGPSSILLGLMSSGLNGQNFAFHGYLPKDKTERLKKIKVLEERSYREGQTQIFMETPYHNQKLFEEVVASCDPKTFLCLAVDLTSQEEFIKTQPIKTWKNSSPPVLQKRPALFLIQKKGKE